MAIWDGSRNSVLAHNGCSPKQAWGTNHFESCGFIRSRAGLAYPDIQYHFLPAAIRYDGRAAFDGHGFQVHVGPNKPDSRGYVRISGPDSDHDPLIQFNYLSTEKDLSLTGGTAYG